MRTFGWAFAYICACGVAVGAVAGLLHIPDHANWLGLGVVIGWTADDVGAAIARRRNRTK